MATPVNSSGHRDPLVGLNTGYKAAAVICLFFGAGIGWAALARIETAVQAEGSVIPTGSNRKAQHLEGGVVSELLVKEGDEVAAGQILVRIAPAQANAALQERQAKIEGLSALTARLAAEAGGASDFPMPVHPTPAMRSEANAFWADKASVEAKIKTLVSTEAKAEADRRSRVAQLAAMKLQEGLLQQSVDMQRGAVSSGAGSKGRMVEAETQLASVHTSVAAIPDAIASDEATVEEARQRRESERLSARADAAQKLGQAEAELAATVKDAEGLQDRLTRTDVRSPVKGLIQKLDVHDIGEVVPPNSTVAEIVPTGDGLVIEARVKPEDMRGLRPGLKALVRMSAYDVSRFGTLDGEVVSLSPDTTKDEHSQQSFFRVRIRTAQNEIGGEPVRIGMQASVSIVTGERSVLEYLTAPVIDWSKVALRDR